MIDLDGFKAVSDHSVTALGDELLRLKTAGGDEPPEGSNPSPPLPGDAHSTTRSVRTSGVARIVEQQAQEVGQRPRSLRAQ